MKRAVIAGLILTNLAAAVGQAKCAGFPLRSHVEATVEVRSCVAVTLNRSDSQFYDMGPMYQDLATLTGTLLGVEVKRSHLVREDPKIGWGDEAHRWKAGEGKALFIAMPAGETCPKSLPSELSVSFRERCCDVLPMKGACLVPGSIYVVELVKGGG
jgi:hypothetical protein